LASKVYKLKTLAYTFDNGFLTKIARENIDNAVNGSGADHYMYKISNQKIMPIYRHFLKNTGLFCPVCMRGINLGRIALRRQYKIPLILRGTSKRTEEWVTPEIFQDSSLYFFKNVLHEFPMNSDVKDFFLDRNLREKSSLALYLLSRKRISVGVMDIQVPDFLEWDYEEIYQTIHKEFGWQKLPDRDEHVDCLVEPVVHYIRCKKVPELTANTLRYSAMIRAGMMKRKEALKLVRQETEESGKLPRQIEHLLSKLDITMDEFEAWCDDSFRHMDFQKKPLAMKLFNSTRTFLGINTSRD